MYISTRRWFLCFSLILLFVSPPTWSEIYTWVDENGKKHFGDKIPSQYQDQATEYRVPETNRSAAVETPERAPTASSNDSSAPQTLSAGIPKSQQLTGCEALKAEYNKSRMCYEDCKLPTGNIARCGHCKQMKKPNC
jgi:hypothetical protein